MRYQLRKFNRPTLVLIMTIFAVLFTLLIAYVFYKISGEEFRQVDFVLAIVAPLIIAPICTWWLFGLLIRLYHLESKMRELAFHDELTHLLTRRAFFESANFYFKIAHRYEKKFGLLMVDLDNFKAINDKYGHLFGDSVLRTFGKLANQLKRKSDIAGRYGGEEFVFVLPDTDANGVLQYAERLHSEFGKISFEHDGEIIRFTISIGVALFDDPANIHEIKTLIGHADHALYRAKAAGKNKIVVYQDQQGECTKHTPSI